MAILSICIPTYNRAELVKNTLNNLIEQIKEDNLENLVEICVSDNASEDNTKEIIEEISKTFPIKYNKNPKNVIWKNLEIVALMGTGEYVWLCSDDEKYDKGLVRHIVNQAQKNKYKYMFLNIDENFNNNYIKTFNIDEDLDCYAKDIIKTAMITLTTLSGSVFKKEVLHKIPTKFVTWYHVEKVFNLEEEDECCVIANPYIHYDTISTWNTKENRVQYYTELFALVLNSKRTQETKDLYLKSEHLRTYYINDIKALRKEKSKAVNFEEIYKLLYEATKNNNCDYFKLELKLLKHGCLWYFYYKKNRLEAKFKRLFKNVKFINRGANSSK